MRWNCKQPEYKDKGKWHSWYAWFPVKVKNEWVWMEYIKRRQVIFTDYLMDIECSHWEYRS